MVSLDQAYIQSLNVPAIKFSLSHNKPTVQFKCGNILTRRYYAMLQRLPTKAGFYILRHTETLLTFCFITQETAFLIGPELINSRSNRKSQNLGSMIVYLSHKLQTPILEKDQCYHQVTFFSQLIGLSTSAASIDQAFQNPITSNELNNIIMSVQFNNQGAHISYKYEQALKTAVMMGDSIAIHSAFHHLLSSGRIGVLSNESTLRAIKNWGIICVSVTLRAAINAGIDYEQAYTLNDQYVIEIEEAPVFDDVMKKIEKILIDMASRVQSLKNVHLSKNIRHIYQTILDTPEETPSIPQYSHQLKLSQNYLSSQFKQEVGITITEFKMLSKINRAIQLISITDLSMAEIAAELNFADQAHLSRQFKVFVGVTPSAARKHPHYLERWNIYHFLKINVG